MKLSKISGVKITHHLNSFQFSRFDKPRELKKEIKTDIQNSVYQYQTSFVTIETSIYGCRAVTKINHYLYKGYREYCNLYSQELILNSESSFELLAEKLQALTINDNFCNLCIADYLKKLKLFAWLQSGQASITKIKREQARCIRLIKHYENRLEKNSSRFKLIS